MSDDQKLDELLRKAADSQVDALKAAIDVEARLRELHRAVPEDGGQQAE